jgi:lysine 2,3-aminomutase
VDVENVSLKVQFKNSREKGLVSLASLVENVVHFLEHYGEISVVGKGFYEIIGDGDGEQKFTRLLQAAEYEDDPQGFFIALVQLLEAANSYEKQALQINRLTLPYLLVLSVLEVLIPGDRFTSVKTVQRFEKLTNTRVPADERAALQRVLELYPVRLSLHTIRQMRLSEAVAYQFMPFVDELNQEGAVHTWVGQFHRGIVEQMYQNRIIFILNMACPVYCRFCFRKHKECRNQRAPKQEHVKNALAYVRISADIKEIVLTGGDPFMNRATLTYAIDGLKEIPHVQTLRIASRSISYYPYLFHAGNSLWLNYLKRKCLELEAKGKRLEIATHFIHPDEVSIDSLDIISELVQSGIPVYVQTPLLRGCNDGDTELAELYNKLRGAGAEMHYIYIVCSPIRGNRRYIAPVSTGIRMAAHLRANLSDRAMPKFCTATSIGKIDWQTSGWVVERDRQDERYIWIRTPYTMDYFNQFAPILQLQQVARVNAEGTLDAKFMGDVGDKELLWGSRQPKHTEAIFPPQQQLAGNTGGRSQEALSRLQAAALEDQRYGRSIVPTGSAALYRTHKTRVELDIGAGDGEVEEGLAYIQADGHITDIVISAQDDALDSMYRLKTVMKQIAEIPHVNAIRLRSLKFNYGPQIFSHALLNQLGKLNNLSIVNPKRLEIETQFLHSGEITPQHGEIAAKLRQKGITVYNITPLLPFINDSEDEILELAYRCRQQGIEFHHLYIAGLPIQAEWSDEYPVDISILIDIATSIRRQESGRSLPRFIISTPLGEADFGLTSSVVETDEEGRVYMALLPYDLDYFRSLDPEFSWPQGVKVDKNGHPIMLINGLKRTPEFLFD